jgi:hypothetical protein
MKTKRCKVFLLISVIFMILTMIFGPRIVSASHTQAPPDKKAPLTRQHPEKPCLKMQQRTILDKLEKIEEVVVREY